MENIRFSVIVPVYNAEKYIKKCLKSLANQTYDNYEVIVVNDGSKDNSEKIIKKFCEKNNKFKLISQKNAGVTAARKAGIEAADGDYIVFVDADDWTKKEMLQDCGEAIEESDADMVQLRAVKVLGPFRGKTEESEKVIFSREEFFDKYVYGLAGGYGILSRAVIKAYRKELIREVFCKKDLKLRIWEDGYMNLLAMTSPNFKTGVILSKVLYYYRKGSGITSSTDEVMQYNECMKSKAAIYDVLVENNIKDFFLQTCLTENIGMTKYFLIDQFKNNPEEKRNEIVSNTFSIPAVVQVREYMAKHPEWNEKKNEFITYSVEDCCKYIESEMDSYGSKSLMTRLKLFLHKIF